MPAAITFGVFEEKVLHIHYTGVSPAFRGLGLAVLFKRAAHAAAVSLSAERSVTENDERDGAIRGVNATMECQVRFGYYRVASDLPASAAEPA